MNFYDTGSRCPAAPLKSRAAWRIAHRSGSYNHPDMTPENITPAEPFQPAGMSEVSRLTGVFFEPKKAFQDIARRPAFLAPLILVILGSVLFTLLLSQRVGWDRVVRQQQELSPRQQERMANMPPETRERAQAVGRMIAPIAAYASSVLGRPIGYLILAAVLLGIVRGIMGAPITLKQMYAVIAYAALPVLIQTALTAVVLYLKSPDDFNNMNPLAFNPAAFMDPMTTAKPLYTIARSLDLFSFWTMLLTAIGIQAAGGKRVSFGGALTAVLVPWAVLVLIGAGLSSLM